MTDQTPDIYHHEDPDWQLVYRDMGDVRYGGFWVKDYGDYAETLEVVELNEDFCARHDETECWTVAIEFGTIGFYTRSVSEAVQRLRGALEFGVGIQTHLREHKGSERRLIAWSEMRRYGSGDTTDSETLHTTDEDEVWERLAEKYGVDLPSDWTQIHKADVLGRRIIRGK